MALSEQQYIMLCKKQIEEKYSLCNRDGYMHRDLEILSRLIEEKTGVSISHSTLKRFWKNKFKQSPQLATLNAAAAMLDFKDWHEFKQANRPGVKHATYKKYRVLTGIALIIVVILAGVLFIKPEIVFKLKKPEITGPVYFSAEKTVTSGIPNTVIFKYYFSKP